MSNTYDSLERAYFPAEYADILLDVLAISKANLLSVKDALLHFRQLHDEHAAELIEHLADVLEAVQPDTSIVMPKLVAAVERAEFLMRRVSEGDHHAFDNLPRVAKDFRQLIAEAKGGRI